MERALSRAVSVEDVQAGSAGTFLEIREVGRAQTLSEAVRQTPAHAVRAELPGEQG